MSLLPPFLSELGKCTRNPTVRRLEELAWRFYEHAKAVLYSEDMVCTGLDEEASNDLQTASTLNDGEQSNARTLQQPGDVSAANPFPDASGETNGLNMDEEPDLEDLFAWWTNETMIDGSFDWLGTNSMDSEEA